MKLLECIPNHMKAKARCICDILKRLDLFFVNRHHEIIFSGEKLKGSNIYSLIEELLLCCPSERISPTRNESMKNPTKCTLKTPVPRMTQRESETNESRNSAKSRTKSRNPPRITKFVSLFDGNKDKDDDSETSSEEDDEPTEKRKKSWLETAGCVF